MAENTTTLLEKWQKQQQDHPEWTPALEDVFYLNHGSGSDRDRIYSLEQVRDLIQVIFELIHMEKNGSELDADGEKLEVSGSGDTAKVDKDGVVVSGTAVGSVRYGLNSIQFIGTDGTTVLHTLTYESGRLVYSGMFSPANIGSSKWKLNFDNGSGACTLSVNTSATQTPNWENVLLFSSDGSISALMDTSVNSGKKLQVGEIHGYSASSTSSKLIGVEADVTIKANAGNRSHGNLTVDGALAVGDNLEISHTDSGGHTQDVIDSDAESLLVDSAQTTFSGDADVVGRVKAGALLVKNRQFFVTNANVDLSGSPYSGIPSNNVVCICNSKSSSITVSLNGLTKTVPAYGMAIGCKDDNGNFYFEWD